MRILVLGASGGVGRHLVRIANDKGHGGTALMRSGQEVPTGVRLVVDGPQTGLVKRIDDSHTRHVSHALMSPRVGSSTGPTEAATGPRSSLNSARRRPARSLGLAVSARKCAVS